MKRTLKTILVDDSKEFREAFKMALMMFPNIKVIAEAANGQEFLEKMKDEVPDLIFMDIEMPDMDGIEATREAMKISGRLRIIALTFHSEFEFTHEMILAGARNYLVKDQLSHNDLHQIIDTI